MNRRALSLQCAIVVGSLGTAILGCAGDREVVAQVPESNTEIEALSRRVDAMLRDFTNQTPGCAVGVDHHGRPLHAAGYGIADLSHQVPIRPTTVFDLASLSKQFTAAGVLLLVQEGRLSLDDHVREHLPWLPRYDEPITVRQLMHHTSGLRDVLSLWSVSGRDPEDHLLPRAVEAAIRRQGKLNHAPGVRSSYSNTNYYLLARIIEVVDGRSFREFLAEELFDPLGMTDSGVLEDYGRVIPRMAQSYAEDDNGELRRRLPKTDLIGASAAYSTVVDMAQWNAFLARSTSTARSVGGPGFVDSLFSTIHLSSGEPVTYAYGLRNQRRRGVHEISHGGTWGGFRTFFRHYPETGLGVTVLCNQLEISPFRLSAQVADAYLGDLVSGPEPEYRPPGAGSRDTSVSRVAPGKGELLEGRYYSPELDTVHELLYRDEGLWVQAGWQEPARLISRDDTTFVREGTTWTVVLQHGEVAGLRMDSGRVRGIEFQRIGEQSDDFTQSSLVPRRPPPCYASTEPDSAFRLAMNAWYDFDFSSANACFERAATLAPSDLMPRLGLVLVHLRPLEGEIVDGAFDALTDIGPTATLRAAEATDDRELEWLRALEELVPGSREEESLVRRYRAFAAAMGDAWRRHPGDLDAAGVHVAALLASAGGSRDSVIYRRVEVAADSVLAIDSRHRGALHYKIHAVDHPANAERGLAAARTYARVAGDSHHAQHMPSHIFLALGMWPEVEAANRRAWQVSRTSSAEIEASPDDHAVHWLIYALLQQDEEGEAADWMDTLTSQAIWGSQPNWFRVELARAALIADADSLWTEWAAPLAPFDSLRGTGRAAQAWASGIAAYRLGDRSRLLEAVRALLDQGAAESGNGETFQDLLNLELGGLLRVLDGRCGDAAELWYHAARLEARRPYGFGPPNPAVPAGELLAAGLRCEGRHGEAASVVEQVVARYPARRMPSWVADIGRPVSPSSGTSPSPITPPRIDGRLGAEEWAGAARYALGEAGEILVLHDEGGGDLYVGIQGPSPGWVHVYLARQETIHVLHASAALGQAVYARDDNGTYGLRSGFDWQLRDPGDDPVAREQRAQFFERHGWLANSGRMGDPAVREFRLSSGVTSGSTRLAVVFAEDAEKPLAWPAVTDGTLNERLVFGEAPATLGFAPETWVEAIPSGE